MFILFTKEHFVTEDAKQKQKKLATKYCIVYWSTIIYKFICGYCRGP